MDQGKLEKILSVADNDDQLKIKILHNASVKGLREYNASSTSSNLNNWKSAEKALESFVSERWTVYFPEERCFSTRLSVAEYLKSNGWKIGKSLLYEHVRRGLLKSQKDGTFLLSDIEKYASTYLLQISGNKTGASEIDAMQSKKLQAETDKLVAQAEHWSIKAKVAAGQYVPRDLFELELAKRAAVFKNDIESFIRAQALGIIHLVDGSADKAPDLIEYMLDQAEDWLDRYAEEKEFKVPQDNGGNETDKEDEEE